MNDFAKQKIAFAIGLLAVLFTVTPLLQPFGELGYSIFGARLNLLRLYYFLSIILLLATYCYAIQFLTERDLRYPAIIGNFLYAVAIVSPAVYITLWSIIYLLGFITPSFKSSVAEHFVAGVVSSIIVVVATEVAARLGRALGRKEKRAAVEQLEQEEMRFLRRAEQLLEADHYDLAVVEAWKAIEVAARRALLKRDVPQSFRLPLHREIEKYGLVPKELIPAFQEVRRTRNIAAHAVERISKEQARNAIELSARILAALAPVDDDGEP
jgi:HEPN domain-containing protein